ncbi:MarR family winged helix-turn-helix transcriptional regulator [Paenibacillus eucommiae]|uniref:DNA-binding MarR family transcriptional regulator n=1 Tax=Paenibacillus eucommiae TaxID=1355755 RepID=A0ABS4IR25_9BACL|nr:MarR family transcriptional regulator [Paenibacillus eucommiae]MBP1990023.1 DNA-binding MarR family transcriptional regulator [Paenibacillus eucommiae]
MTENVNVLDSSIGFIMGVTYRKISSLFQHRLKEYDITPEQWSVLYQIARAEGLIQKVIAGRSGKDKPTTTRILDHLEGKGLIYKEAGTNDRRAFLVYITAKGTTLIQETTPIEQQLIKDIKQCVSEEEYNVLVELLLRINNFATELTDRE